MIKKGLLYLSCISLLTLVAVSCSDDDIDDLVNSSSFSMYDIADLVDAEELPISNSWTITNSYLSYTNGTVIAQLVKMAYDEGRTISLTLSNETKIREKFLVQTQGIESIYLPNVVELEDQAFWGSSFSVISLTTEEDFVSVSESAFSTLTGDSSVTLYLNANKEGETITNLTDREWTIKYQ